MNEKVPPSIPPPVIKPPAPPQIPSRGLGRISGAEGLTPQELREAAGRGGRFIVFPYCISALVVSFRRSSPVFFIKPGESVFAKGALYCLISLFAGWWGIPWGPIWTLISLATNLSGGKDVTPGVLSALGITAPVTTTPPEVSPMVAAERKDRKTFIMRLAWAVVALIVLGVACVGYKIYEANRKAPATPGQTEFRAANSRIGTLGTDDSGNTAKAAELAGQMSKGMSLLRDLGFEQAKEKSFIDDRDQFKTYCDLRDDHCVFLIQKNETSCASAVLGDKSVDEKWQQPT
jgi:hypothetical protein